MTMFGKGDGQDWRGFTVTGIGPQVDFERDDVADFGKETRRGDNRTHYLVILKDGRCVQVVGTKQEKADAKWLRQEMNRDGSFTPGLTSSGCPVTRAWRSDPVKPYDPDR